MEVYKKAITIKVENDSDFKRKLKAYFQFYNFQFKDQEENKLVFFKKKSFLSGWKYNPLNWESIVNIKITNNNLEISYINEGNAQITPFAFDELFTSFFHNLELYLNKSIDFKEKNNIEIKKVKKRVIFQFLILLLSIICFGLIGKFFLQKFRIQFFDYFSIAIGGLITLKLINQYWINKMTEN